MFDKGLNAPTGAWCSLTEKFYAENEEVNTSQCTYRCVVLPDFLFSEAMKDWSRVSMHLQVRGAP